MTFFLSLNSSVASVKGQHLGTCQANHTTVYILMANLRIMCIDGLDAYVTI